VLKIGGCRAPSTTDSARPFPGPAAGSRPAALAYKPTLPSHCWLLEFASDGNGFYPFFYFCFFGLFVFFGFLVFLVFWWIFFDFYFFGGRDQISARD
jgi:hypothetical protein